MRHHPKVNEDVFSSDSPSNTNRINLEYVTSDWLEVDGYTKLFKDFLKDFYSDLWNQCVKLSWLRRIFIYKGHRMKVPTYLSDRSLQGKFAKFMRRFVGHDLQIITKSYFFLKLETHYFEQLFPGFALGDPFHNPGYYKFPYENITLEYLLVVYQLDDRFELLKEADKQKMTYAVFLDYVLNHIIEENIVLGREKYGLIMGSPNQRQSPYYFRDYDKDFSTKKGQKRT